MHGGALLGKKLTSYENIELALRQWEREVRPYIEQHRKETPRKAQVFVPSNRLVFAVRSTLLTSGFMARFRAFRIGVARRHRARAEQLSAVFGERGVRGGGG